MIFKWAQMNWVGDKSPGYMRKDDFIPCDCEMCVTFVEMVTLQGLTMQWETETEKAGIHPIQMYQEGKVETCMEVTERVDLMKHSNTLIIILNALQEARTGRLLYAEKKRRGTGLV